VDEKQKRRHENNKKAALLFSEYEKSLDIQRENENLLKKLEKINNQGR
jgi:hypothetical protein